MWQVERVRKMNVTKLFYYLAVFLGLVFVSVPARAEPYIYACEIIVDLRYETHLLTIDEDKHAFQWRGKTYQITDTSECAKSGWHVIDHGTSFNFCTATKGVASFYGQPKSVADSYHSRRRNSCSPTVATRTASRSSRLRFGAWWTNDAQQFWQPL